MGNEKKWSDQEIAAVACGALILGSLVFYWALQFDSTLELLELAYGSVKFFNNPLVF